MKTDPKTGRTTDEIFAHAGELNDAIARVTAFKNSTELHDAIVNDGYTPTLRPEVYAGKGAAGMRRDILNVRAYLRAHGFSVFPETVTGER